MSSIVKTVSLTSLVIIGLAGTAHARPDLRKMACAEAQEMVQRLGAVVFTTGQFTYSRFVANQSYCERGQITYPQYGATRDNPQCFVAYECREPIFRTWPW